MSHGVVVNVTVKLPLPLHAMVKRAAVKRAETLQDFVVRALQERARQVLTEEDFRKIENELEREVEARVQETRRQVLGFLRMDDIRK